MPDTVKKTEDRQNQVAEWVARAPMTYPVPFDLLPAWAMHRPCTCGKPRQSAA